MITSAHNVVMCEFWWTPTAHWQAEGRIHRYGQEQPTTAYYLFVPDTIEDKMQEILLRKMSIIGNVIEGGNYEDFSIAGEFLDWLISDYAPTL